MSQPKRRVNNNVEVDEIHQNTTTQLITITTDKLKLILFEHLKHIECSKAWQTPLGIVLTIILVFCSASFKEAFGLSADTWTALFILGLGLSLFWLMKSLIQIKKNLGIDDVMDAIKNKGKVEGESEDDIAQ